MKKIRESTLNAYSNDYIPMYRHTSWNTADERKRTKTVTCCHSAHQVLISVFVGSQCKGLPELAAFLIQFIFLYVLHRNHF